MRKRISEVATLRGVSMNTAIVQALEAAFPEQQELDGPRLVAEVASIAANLQSLAAQLQERGIKVVDEVPSPEKPPRRRKGGA